MNSAAGPRSRQVAAHPGAQAISFALAAITPSNVRLACAAAGSHSVSVVWPGPWNAGASSRPRWVAWSITCPAGSLTCRPSRAPVALARGPRPG